MLQEQSVEDSSHQGPDVEEVTFPPFSSEQLHLVDFNCSQASEEADAYAQADKTIKVCLRPGLVLHVDQTFVQTLCT